MSFAVLKLKTFTDLAKVLGWLYYTISEPELVNDKAKWWS